MKGGSVGDLGDQSGKVDLRGWRPYGVPVAAGITLVHRFLADTTLMSVQPPRRCKITLMVWAQRFCSLSWPFQPCQPTSSPTGFDVGGRVQPGEGSFWWSWQLGIFDQPVFFLSYVQFLFKC